MRNLLIVFVALALLACTMPGASALAVKNWSDFTCGNNDPLYNISNMFDDNEDTYYYADMACQAIVRVCFHSPSTIKAAYVYQDWTQYSPRTYRFVNGSNSNDYDFFKSIPAGGTTVTFTGNINASDSCMFVSASDYISFNTSELKFYGSNATFDDYNITANFYADQTNTTATATIQFTDSSTVSDSASATYNWTITPATGVTGYIGSAKNHTAVFSLPGNFTVSHGVQNSFGSDIETKTDYITIYASNETVWSGFSAINGINGYQIALSNISIVDDQTGNWTNFTLSSTGSELINILNTHTMSGYAEAGGYDSGELLAQTPIDGVAHPILLFPHNATNVSAGNVTLYVTVQEMYSGGLPISGATVEMTYNFPNIVTQYTDTNGMTSFVVPNNTVIYVAAKKAGYVGTSESMNSGTGSGGSASVAMVIELTKQTTTPTVTATTGPGGTTPVTVDPYPCVGDGSYQDTLNCQRKQTEMGADVIQYAPLLIQLFILATIVGVIKIMGKK